MSEIINIKRGCEKRLSGITPSIQIAFEGVNFTAPNAMYLKCQFRMSPPDDPVFGTGYHRERVQFQVFVVDPTGTGTTNAIAKAEVIRDLFTKGTTINEAGTPMYVLSTPSIQSAFISQGKVLVPILIDITAEVF